MRISDWSSDVCSSDLGVILLVRGLLAEKAFSMRRLTVESAERTVISWVFARASRSAINATDTRSKPTEESAMTAETLATEGNFVLASDRKSTRLNSSH